MTCLVNDGSITQGTLSESERLAEDIRLLELTDNVLYHVERFYVASASNSIEGFQRGTQFARSMFPNEDRIKGYLTNEVIN